MTCARRREPSCVSDDARVTELLLWLRESRERVRKRKVSQSPPSRFLTRVRLERIVKLEHLVDDRFQFPLAREVGHLLQLGPGRLHQDKLVLARGTAEQGRADGAVQDVAKGADEADVAVADQVVLRADDVDKDALFLMVSSTRVRIVTEVKETAKEKGARSRNRFVLTLR